LQIIVKILDTAFLSPHSEQDLGARYTVHLSLIGELVADVLLVLTELFNPGVRAKELRANIDRKSPFLKVYGRFRPKFQVVGDVIREPFLHG